MENQYRVAIIGAGPAGCSCAIALLNAGFKNIVLIDASKPGKFHIGESIPPDMNPIMRELGIYSAFYAENHEPCFGSCSYWGSPLRGYNDSILSPFGHGWHLDRTKFNALLQQQAMERGALVLNGFAYQNALQKAFGYELYLKSDTGETKEIQADFVVDASGARSVFATEMGGHKLHSTPLVCLALRFKCKTPHEVSKLTHLESVEDGWWYAAKIPGELLLVTFYTLGEVAKELALNNRDNWLALLQKAPNTQSWVSQMEPYDNKLLGFSAPSFCQKTFTGKQWMAIGDAASTYDPITAQGIIKSISQGMRAAETIAYYARGAHEALLYFETELKRQYAQYTEARRYFYQLEQRWPNHTFWKIMHGI